MANPMTRVPGAKFHSCIALLLPLLWPSASAAQTTQTLPPPMEMSIASASAAAGAPGPAGSEQQVSSTGAAIYTIPLETPRGRHGLGPTVDVHSLHPEDEAEVLGQQ
jgi:hypothetical protein